MGGGEVDGYTAGADWAPVAEAAEATDGQFWAWLLRLPADQRLETLGRMRAHGHTARVCWQADHAGAVVEVRRLMRIRLDLEERLAELEKRDPV